MCDNDDKQRVDHFIQAALLGDVVQLNAALERGDNLRGMWTWGGSRTALWHAAGGGHTEACNLLLHHWGAEVDAIDEEGATALFEAARHGHATTCAVLLQEGANVNAVTDYGNTALRAAVSTMAPGQFGGGTAAVRHMREVKRTSAVVHHLFAYGMCKVCTCCNIMSSKPRRIWWAEVWALSTSVGALLQACTFIEQQLL